MGHYVQAFIGQRPVLERIVARFQHSPVVDLPQDLALLPLTGDLYDSLPMTADALDPSFPSFMLLTPKVRRLLTSASDARGLLYFETHYAGGVGTQGAIVARDGAVVFGPASGPGTINTALKVLGVRTHVAKLDEFETIGLDTCRDNERWLAQSRGTDER